MTLPVNIDQLLNGNIVEWERLDFNFHKSWGDRNPIEIRINPTSIEVLNFAGPMPPITNEDLKKTKIINRSYRNR